MNEFIQTKIGEVLAFARVGTDTLAKGNEGFSKILDADQLSKLTSDFGDLQQKISAFIAKENVTEEVEKNAKETFDKVTSMRDTYIEDNWAVPSEVLEWMGFYTGASMVHWYLVSGAAASLGISELEDMSKEAIDQYSSLFSADEKFLKNIGKTNASE